MAGLGKAWQGAAGQAWRGEARRGMVWQAVGGGTWCMVRVRVPRAARVTVHVEIGRGSAVAKRGAPRMDGVFLARPRKSSVGGRGVA